MPWLPAAPMPKATPWPACASSASSAVPAPGMTINGKPYASSFAAWPRASHAWLCLHWAACLPPSNAPTWISPA
ncbi:hypothetical protein G6F24_017554 [Rhizopus arrhizus]|nr:hypothetical protein G6F24_017554 [Rhizopus arrhizus]